MSSRSRTRRTDEPTMIDVPRPARPGIPRPATPAHASAPTASLRAVPTPRPPSLPLPERAATLVAAANASHTQAVTLPPMPSPGLAGSRNAFPPPPSNRPRVFAHRDDDERTRVRPRVDRDDHTILRPMSAMAPIAAPDSRKSIPPTAITLPRLPPVEREIVLPTFAPRSKLKVGAIATACIVAPFFAVIGILSLVGDRGDDRASPARSAAAGPQSTAAFVLPQPIQVATPIANAPNLTQSGGFAPPAPPPTGELRSPLPPPPSPAPAPARAVAHAAAHAIVAAPMPIAKKASSPAKPAEGASAISDAQAADALAKAQLEAALR